MNTITEHLLDWSQSQPTHQPKQKLIKGITLAGLTSRNGYTYKAEALKQAAAQYNSKPVFLDHPPNIAKPHLRSTKDLIGTITNARFEKEKLTGDIQLVESQASELFLSLLNTKPPFLGMSHVVLAQRSPDQKTVLKIDDVISVDLVMFPATTHSLTEQTHMQTTSQISYEDLLALIDQTLPEHLAVVDPSLKDPIRYATYADSLLFQTTTNSPTWWTISWSLSNEGILSFGEDLTPAEPPTQNEDPQQTSEHIHQLLPHFAMTPLFQQQLKTASPQQRKQLITERRQLIQNARHTSPQSSTRIPVNSSAMDDQTFLAALKRN